MFYHSILWSLHRSKQQESLALISCLIVHVYKLMISLQSIILIVSCFIADNASIKHVETSTIDVSLTLQTSTLIWITLNNCSETKSSSLTMMMLLLKNLLSFSITSESTHKKTSTKCLTANFLLNDRIWKSRLNSANNQLTTD